MLVLAGALVIGGCPPMPVEQPDGADSGATAPPPGGAPGQAGPGGPQGEARPPGPQGEAGPQGPAGTPCWDVNGNGLADPDEDVNGDGRFDALDCQGPPGP